MRTKPTTTEFVKYLVVKGKIKEDKQKYLSFLDGYDKPSEFDSSYDYGLFSPSNPDMGCKACKQFICSLDVKPEDKVRYSFRPTKKDEFILADLEKISFMMFLTKNTTTYSK